jgi:DNA repair/transcription protein MET18/MMS19
MDILEILANKYKIEGSTNANFVPKYDLISMAAGQLTTSAVGGDSLEDEAASTTGQGITDPIIAITAGILPRYAGGKTSLLLKSIIDAVGNGRIGLSIARGLGHIFQSPLTRTQAAQTFRPYLQSHPLRKEFFAVIKPLWQQRAYVELIKPMISSAWPQDSANSGQTAVSARYAVAILNAVCHLDPQIWSEDVDTIIRLVLRALGHPPLGNEAESGMKILIKTTVYNSEPLMPHLRSIVKSCISIYEQENRALTGTAVSSGGHGANTNKHVISQSLSIDLLGRLAVSIPRQQLSQFVPTVDRILYRACGNGIREIRKSAMVARANWIKETTLNVPS